MTGRVRLVFVSLELVLLCAIPVLAYAGFRTLLDTRTGTFVEDPGPSDPGWQALIDPSPVLGVVEVVGGEVSGITVVVSVGQTARGGTAVLVPAQLEVAGRPIGLLSPESAVEAVAATMRLRIPEIEVVDEERWESLLGETAYLVDNPDPVPGDGGTTAFDVGIVEVSGGRTALFLGRTAEGANPLASLVRRELFWDGLLDDPPPVSDDQLSRRLQAISGGLHEVVPLPLVRSDTGAPAADGDRVEELIRRVVPFPAAHAEGERLRVRVEDRTGQADLDQVALGLGGLGMEVVAISNGAVFDDDSTALRVRPAMPAVERVQLSEQFAGIGVRADAQLSIDDAVVLQLGPEHTEVIDRILR